MTIYEKNLQALSQRGNHSRIVDYCGADAHFTETMGEIAAEILQAGDGEPVVVYHRDGQDYYLTSVYHPSHAAERFMKEYVEIPDQAGLILFGLSSGIYAETFLKMNQNQVFCICYEPSREIFLQVMQSVDISGLLSNPEFFLVVHEINEGDIAYYLSLKNRSETRMYKKYVLLPQYGMLFPDQLSDFKDAILENEMQYQMMINTIIKTGGRVCYTTIQNFRYLPGCRSAYDYSHVFPADLPVIVVAAGPSLEKNVELLHEAEGKALIIVVDSAIRTVYRRGIRPDFVITIDNSKKLENFDVDGISDAFLLADEGSNTDVLDKIKPENLIFFSSGTAVWSRLFREEGTNMNYMYSSGSVALDAITFSIVMGFKKIILIGQDLALTDGKQYADGNRVDSYEGMSIQKVKDIYGNEILTKGDYYSFIQSIENIAYQHPEVEIIDATEGGAFKKNTTIMTLREAIDQYCIREYPIKEVIESAPRRFVDHGVQKILQTLQGMKEHILTIQTKMETGVKECEQAEDLLLHGKADIGKLKEINRRITELDSEFLSMEEYGYFEMIASKADYDFAKELYNSEREDIAEAIRLYKKSEQYYRGLVEAAPKIAAMIDECIEKTRKQYYIV